IFVDRYVLPPLRALLLVGGRGTSELAVLQGELARPQVWQSRRGRSMVANALLIVNDPLRALEDPNLRPGAILQLGEKRAIEATRPLLPFLDGDDPTEVLLTIDALVRIAEACDVKSDEFDRIAAGLRAVARNPRRPGRVRRRARQGLRALGLPTDDAGGLW